MALKSPQRPTLAALRIVIFGVALILGPWLARAELRFDVFLGYDGTIREAAWFPVTCEIVNDGPPFNGFIEIKPANFGGGQTQRFPIELPTGTLKKVLIPTFAASRYQNPWDIQLLDARGKVRAEALAVRPQKQIGWETKFIGALARTAGGGVSLCPIKRKQPDIQPAVARLQPPVFPDNPLLLESFDAIYLNSEIAVTLRSSQADALTEWLNAGGHLIVAIEQISDVSGVPWLRNLLPCEPEDIVSVTAHEELEAWVEAAARYTNNAPSPNSGGRGKRRRPQMAPEDSGEPFVGPAFGTERPDRAFEAAEIKVVTGRLRDGRPLVSAGGHPLLVTADRGLGRVTVLMFSPEREPFKSWQNLPALWTVLLDVPLELYTGTDFNSGYGSGADGIFGAMIDSRQVHKLPLGWLLLLLVVYLLVIGPLDRIWLKKINKPMLTWLTFPGYVLCFSGLIYLIGYKLRAGDSECNELHVVDVIAKAARTELRGTTYVSIYSPANARYPLRSALKCATLRGEYLGSRGGESSAAATILHTGDNFKADVSVPVWTSQLVVSDWWQPGTSVLEATLQPVAGGWQIKVMNHTAKPITTARLVWQDLVYDLGPIAASDSKTMTLSKAAGIPVDNFVNDSIHHYAEIAQQRQYAFGRRSSGQIDDLAHASMVVSLVGEMGAPQNGMRIVAATGLDVSKALLSNRAVLLAWSPDAAPVPALNQFKTKRTGVNTLWRLPVAVSDQP